MPARILIALLLLFSTPAWAELVRIEVKSRADLLGGQAFGTAGAYEKLVGVLHFAIDPANSANRIIADLDKAPRNARGLVEFSSDFYLIKPKDPSRGNGSLLYEVSNRGGKGMIGFFNFASGSLDPATSAQLGDGFLLSQGFTLLWVGWQFDPPTRPGLVRVFPPMAREADGREIRGPVRSDFVVIEAAKVASLADRDHQAYIVADPADPAAVLTVRDTVEGARQTIPRADWQFAEDGASIRMAAGFQPKKIYEVVYTAKNPPLVGVGPAAVRDAVSRLKYGSASELGIDAGMLKRAIGFGISQSGRFLRTFLYYGFNEDEAHRKVFDGVMPHVAGAGRGSFNHRFAQASRDGHPFINFFYPTDIFPFTDEPQRDPESGVTDGLLTHALKLEHRPKVFYTNSSYEYWGRAASLIHTSVDGTRDVAPPPDTRIYLLSAGQHGVAAFPPSRTIGQQTNNPLDYRWVMRSLLVSMNRWVTDGTAPPESRYPRIADGTLVAPAKMAFPKIPGVNVALVPHLAYRADYGPDFNTRGVVSKEPPVIGAAFPVLVPQVDADGNELAGVRVPELAVPVATYTGWNLFNERSGPTDVVSSMQGSFIPLAATKVDRERTGDPRKAVDERYENRAQFLARIGKVATDLADQGYLLPADLARIADQAGTRWDLVAGRSSSQ